MVHVDRLASDVDVGRDPAPDLAEALAPSRAPAMAPDLPTIEAYLSKIARTLTREPRVSVKFDARTGVQDVLGDLARTAAQDALGDEAYLLWLPKHASPLAMLRQRPHRDPRPSLTVGSAIDDALLGYVDLLAARFNDVDQSRIAALGSAHLRDIAQCIDDYRACTALMTAYPGSRPLLAAYRQRFDTVSPMQWEQMSAFAQFRHRVIQHLWRDHAVKSAADHAKHSNDAGVREVTPAFKALIGRARATRSTAESIAFASVLLRGISDTERSDFNNMVSDIVYGESTLPQDANDAEDGLAGDAEQSRPPSGSPDGEAQHSGASSQHSDMLIEATAQTPPPSSSHTGRSAQPRPILSIPLSTAFDTVTDFTGKGNASQWHKLRGVARSRTSSLKAKLERALQAQEQVHWQRDQERGDIDRSSVAKLAMSAAYRTPFRQKRRAPTREAAVTLLIDLSGSMAGEKLTLARRCAAALADALTELEFTCEVLGYSSIEEPRMRALYEAYIASGRRIGESGFNRYLEKLDLRVYKRFDSRNLNGLAMIECGHENPDGEALAWAADRLLAQRAKRRILLVLSDGYPATGEGHPLILKTDLLARIKRCEQAGIDLIGIGVLEDAVETFYPNNVVVRDLEDLPSTVFAALQNTLLNT